MAEAAQSSDAANEAALEKVTKTVEEISRLDVEKVVAAAGPYAEPAIRAWHAGQAERIKAATVSDIEKTRVQEAALTARHRNITIGLCAIVGATAALAAWAVSAGQGNTAEKIVIGLFGFLAGFGVPRR